jgi:hypothetical protein
MITNTKVTTPSATTMCQTKKKKKNQHHDITKEEGNKIEPNK